MRTSLKTGARRPLTKTLAAVLSGLVWVSMAVVPAAAAGDNTLSTLSITNPSATLDPPFVSETEIYTGDAVTDASSPTVRIAATATDAQAVIAYRLNQAADCTGSSGWLSSSTGSLTVTNAVVDVGTNRLCVRVTPNSPKAAKIYNVTLNIRTAQLSALSVTSASCGSFDSAFTTLDYSYELDDACPSGNFSLPFSLTTRGLGSAVTYALNGGVSNPVTLTAGATNQTGSFSVNLDAPTYFGYKANTLAITVTQGASSKVYTVSIYKKAASPVNANLSGLVLDSQGGALALSPVFDGNNQTSYVAEAGALTAVSFTATKAIIGQRLEFRVGSGAFQTVTTPYSGETVGTFPVSLSGASTVVQLRVTGTDRSTQKTYTVTISGGSPAGATLTGLTLSPAPTNAYSFAPGTFTYNVSYAAGTSSVSVTATTAAGTLSRKIGVNGTPTNTTSGSAFTVNLAENAVTTLIVTVTNGAATQNYTVNFTRGTAAPTLATLSLGSACQLTPAFTSGMAAPTTPFACTVLATTASVSVSATPTTNGDTVQWKIGTGDFGTAASLTLAAGTNNIEVRVTRSGGGGGGGGGGGSSSSSTYRITVTKPGAPGLSALALTANGKPVVLSPAFAATTSSYEAKVLGTRVTISLTKSDANATVKAIVEPSKTGTKLETALTGPSFTTDLEPGLNTVTLEVTPAGGGTSTNYVIQITAPRCKVVNVVGMTVKDARAKLKQSNCLVRVERESSSTIAKGRVIRQDPVVSLTPKQNKRAPGFRVTIYVSKGR